MQTCHHFQSHSAYGWAALALPFMSQARARAREVWELPEVSGYFDDQDHFKTVKSLCSYTHPIVPGAMFGNLNSLKRKLQEQHKLHFCDLCIKGRKVRLLSSWAAFRFVKDASSSSVTCLRQQQNC
jgi:hypothetical protein